MAPRRPALAGWHGILATLACFLPVFLGFILPGFILLRFAARRLGRYFLGRLFRCGLALFVLALVASLVVVVLGLILAYAHRCAAQKECYV